MEIMKPNLDGITECNTIKGVIREAKIRDMDVACCFFNKCYEANVETDKMEFSSCEFKDCICLNSKFEKVYFTDVLFENCDFSNTMFYECNFVRVTFRNCKLVGSNLCNVNMYNILIDNTNVSYANMSLGTYKEVCFAESKLSNSVIKFSFKYNKSLSHILQIVI